MAEQLNATGSYTAPNGQDVSYEFTYEVFSSEIISALNAIVPGAGKDLQRMRKIDANNSTRERVKAENGHSTRKPMTEEQKIQAKASRQADKELLAILKEKGLSIADLKNL